MANKDILNHAEAKFAKAKEATNSIRAAGVEARETKTAKLKAERLARDAKHERAAASKGTAAKR